MANYESYLITGKMHRFLKKRGYTFTCARCHERIGFGDFAVTNLSKRLKYIFHKNCWGDLSKEFSSKSSLRRISMVQPNPKAHIALKPGVYSVNPHPQVLCPQLQSGRSCRKLDKHHEFLRPQLFLAHHIVEGLSLWRCEGCPSFLLRVQKP